jgi:hypothetical protein
MLGYVFVNDEDTNLLYLDDDFYPLRFQLILFMSKLSILFPNLANVRFTMVSSCPQSSVGLSLSSYYFSQPSHYFPFPLYSVCFLYEIVLAEVVFMPWQVYA